MTAYMWAVVLLVAVLVAMLGLLALAALRAGGM